MKTTILGLIFALSSIILSAQTFEPTPLSFNWGSHSGPFHDSTQKQLKPVLGWEWGNSDSSFDAYMHANTTHGGANYPFVSDTNTGKNINVIKELNGYCFTGFRFDPEATPNLTSFFRPHKYDSSGAAFGWETVDTSIVSLDTATASRPKGYAVLQGSGSGLALSGIRPNNRLKRIFDIPDIYEGNNVRGKNGRYWMLTANLRRFDSTSVDTSGSTAISFKIKYWARKIYTVIGSNPARDTVEYDTANYIRFDSVAANYQWHTRGYWDTQFTGISGDTTRFTIPRSLLPLHGVPGQEPDVTLSAFFRLDGIRNPLMGMENEGANKRGTFFIDSIDVEVYYHGFPVALDYVRVEVPDSRRLHRGDFDTTIHNDIQAFITGLASSNPTARLFRISPSIEMRVMSYPAARYYSKLFNGFITSASGEYAPHQRHILAAKNDWYFGLLGSIGYSVAVPWFRAVGDDSVCYRDVGNYTCRGLPQAMGYSVGYASLTYLSSNYGDTLKSFYETAAVRWTNGNYAGYFSGAELKAFDTLAMQKYLDTTKAQIGFQTAHENNYLNYITPLGDDPQIYGNKPWWAQRQIHTIYKIRRHFVTDSSWQTSFETQRPYTGEEIRYLLWCDIIRGAKGIMIDNAGYAPLNPKLDSIGNLKLDSYGNAEYDNGYGGFLTLRKVKNYRTVYNPDSSLDTDFLVGNDPTKLQNWMNKPRVARLLYDGDTNRIYIGLKSARNAVRHAFLQMEQNGDEIMRLKLLSWVGKGYKTWYSGDTAAFGKAVKYVRDDMRVRPLGRDSGFASTPWYEPWDSTFYDLTYLRDAERSPDSIFYVGICNRRTDPLRYMHVPISDTGAKRLQFWSSSEFLDSCRLSPDSLLWRNEWQTQIGTREFTLPFNYKDSLGRYALLRVRELGAGNAYLDSVYPYRNDKSLYDMVDTVVGQDKAITFKLLPGEGKIFRVEVLRGTTPTGDLAYNGQTKITGHALMRFDSTSSSWIEGDTMVYYRVAHKPIVPTVGVTRTGVYFAKSKPTSRWDDNANLQWEAEILLSDTVEHSGRWNVADSCAYPSIVTRFNPEAQTYDSYIVYSCLKADTAYEFSTGTNWHYIIESIVRSNDTAVAETLRGVMLDSVKTRDMSEWGTPMINASDTANFYAYSDLYRGIVVGWK